MKDCIHCGKKVKSPGINGDGWACLVTQGQCVCNKCHITTEHALLHALSGDMYGSASISRAIGRLNGNQERQGNNVGQ